MPQEKTLKARRSGFNCPQLKRAYQRLLIQILYCTSIKLSLVHTNHQMITSFTQVQYHGTVRVKLHCLDMY